jgi:NOL1/NOP2/sun family putative RNA methylase
MSNLPIEFTERMKALLGNEYPEFEAAFDNDEERYHALRVNMCKCRDTEKLMETLRNASSEAQEEKFTQVPWEEKGIYYDAYLSPGKHPYHEAGLYYIQEPSAMAPVHYLDPQPGERILDLCAAPGGKSTQIADCMRGEGLLVSNEINRDRARILSLNMERMGIRNAMVLNEDPEHLSEVFECYFDRILVDAPCSGEGMFRKNDVAGEEWSPENVRLCAERQATILDAAARMLLPGGRLVYSTCTFSPDENEQTIAGFLFRHRDFRTESIDLVGGIENGRPNWAESVCDDKEILGELSNTARLWPHRVRGEGHFLCVLKREGTSDKGALKSYIPGGRFVRAKGDVTKPLMEFLEEALEITSKELKAGELDITLNGGDHLKGGLFPFGDQIYLAPSDMPNPHGLKILRCGLHLGTVKKDRFEPSHALALAIDPEAVRLSYDLSSDSSDIKAYLNGQTLRLSGDDPDTESLKKKKGWCLITTDGYSCGWAKLAGGMLKNHYPKGLRINY